MFRVGFEKHTVPPPLFSYESILFTSPKQFMLPEVEEPYLEWSFVLLKVPIFSLTSLTEYTLGPLQ